MNNRLFVNITEDRGRGVFAAAEFSESDLIEICPIIKLSQEDRIKIHETHLHDYYFLWGKDHSEAAIALGYGSLYNHSDRPNAEITLDLDKETIDIISLKDIKVGDEITIDYHAGLEKRSLWFDK